MMITRYLRVLPVILLAIVAGILINGCGPDDESSDGTTSVSGSNASSMPTMPEFSLERLDGGTLTQDDLLGKPSVLNFEASWCGPCEFEAPVFAAAQSHPDVNFFGIAVKDDKGAQQNFIDKHGWQFPIGLDFTGRVVTDFQKEAQMPRGAIPTTFFIDSMGVIVDVWIGPITEADLTEMINNLLAAEAANNAATDASGGAATGADSDTDAGSP